MAFSIVTPAVGLPLTVDQVKSQSRIVYSDAGQDELLSLYIQSAVNYIQRRTARQLMTATYKYVADCFPSDYGSIWLPIAPVQSITSVEYIAEDGSLTTWASEGWTSDVISEPSRVEPVYNNYWPVAQQTLNAVQVTFVAGYGNAAAVPAELKLAIATLAAHYYENREATVDVELLDVPYTINDMIDIYRWHPNSFAVLV